MPATTPRRGRPGYDADTILRRAIDLFIRQGYEATSMGDLAVELGLSKSAIYHHVPSKEHLLAAALDEALDGLHTRVDALYFTVVTMATVGYGDVHAEGQGARMLVIGLIIFDVVIVASLVRLLPQLRRNQQG